MDGNAHTIRTGCAIAGGGPAGMMLGLMLARAGVDVTVLEKHADFLRDFRGDTIHPSTLEAMHELGLLDGLLTRPHQKVDEVEIEIGSTRIPVADFTHLPTRCKFIAFMPQWDFLDYLSGEGKRLPNFRLSMEAEVTGLIEEDGRVAGLLAETPEGPVRVEATLTVGADGRGSVVREKAGLSVEDIGAPFDVLWLRLPRAESDPDVTLGRVNYGHVFITLNRGDYWQCAFIIPKGGLEAMKTRGLDDFRERIAMLAPHMRDRTGDIRDWDDIKLLTVKIDRLKNWARDGLLCIGDAAHAMSPVGGVGINLAIQDAVAAANLLAGPLKAGTLKTGDLERVQKRRMFPTRVTQGFQVLAQRFVIEPVLRSSGETSPPWPFRLFGLFPVLRRLPARAIGMGVQPEHAKVGR
ncbi:FAD-dependent oxidoreductase [Parvibaculum sp.]|uniref:FAD-dependent oxidoreductase n=2 Tax=Parvibaculum sp. TaxID=2024848 RepID=UPI002FD9FF93